ncbi:MAG: POTRA domain-containing protein [Betaproteobacteria bacterium]
MDRRAGRAAGPAGRARRAGPTTALRAGALGLVLIGTVLAGTGRADVADYLGKPVGSVRLVIEGRATTDATLTNVVETPTGAPLSMAAVRETLSHLFSLGRFEDVRVDASLDAGRVALVYELSPIHQVTRIEFAGTVDAAGVDEGRLRAAATGRYGPAPALGRAVDVARVVADALHEQGYLHARVTPRAVLHHDPDRATLVLQLDVGNRTHVGSVNIVGAPALDRAGLLDALGLKPGAPYRREAVDLRVDQYVEGRRRKGYYETRLMPSVVLADDDRVANVTLTVVPGPHVRVVFTGDALPASVRTDLVPVEREGSADEDLLEDSSNRIEEYLRAQGYRDAAAPHTRSQKDDELTIAFDVRKGPLYRVRQVEISGNAALPLSTFADRLRTRTGQPFASASLDADVSAIEGIYHRSGFASARVQAAVDAPRAPAGAAEILVDVRIAVREGARTLVGSVRLQGNASVPADTLRKSLTLQPGRPFYAADLAVDRDAIELQYANLGYPNATVTANPGLSADGTRADVVFAVREGPRVFVDHVLIIGNFRTSRQTILRELQFKAGDPLGLAAVNESQRRLASLGLFRSVRIAELAHGDESHRDVLVTVEEAPATTISYGGGFEVRPIIVQGAAGTASTQLEFAPRASFSIGRANLFGKRRSVNLFTSVSQLLNSTTAGGGGFTEYRLLGTYREPRLFGTPADAVLTATIEQQLRSSFDFSRRSLTGDVAQKLSRTVSVSGDYQIQRVRVFNEVVSPSDKLLIDRLFPQVRLSSFSGSVIRDTRDDPIDPTRGNYVSANGQLAGRAIGSQVGFAKTFMTGELFRMLPHAHGIVFAGDARLGMAAGFPRPALDSNGNPVLGADGLPQAVKDLPPSERFFAGGDTTVRGFGLDELGTSATIDQNGFPIGGNALVIFNAELRVPVRGGLGVVGFFDTGNVFTSPADINLGELRSAAGFGFRYKSPVGPIRIDLGFKLHRLEIVPGRREALTALHISLGQAF